MECGHNSGKTDENLNFAILKNASAIYAKLKANTSQIRIFFKILKSQLTFCSKAFKSALFLKVLEIAPFEYLIKSPFAFWDLFNF